MTVATERFGQTAQILEDHDLGVQRVVASIGDDFYSFHTYCDPASEWGVWRLLRDGHVAGCVSHETELLLDEALRQHRRKAS